MPSWHSLIVAFQPHVHQTWKIKRWQSRAADRADIFSLQCNSLKLVQLRTRQKCDSPPDQLRKATPSPERTMVHSTLRDRAARRSGSSSHRSWLLIWQNGQEALDLDPEGCLLQYAPLTSRLAHGRCCWDAAAGTLLLGRCGWDAAAGTLQPMKLGPNPRASSRHELPLHALQTRFHRSIHIRLYLDTSMSACICHIGLI